MSPGIGRAVPTVAALAVMVVWGATPVATRLAVAELDPVMVALLRTVVGGAAAVPIALALGVARPRGPRAIGYVLAAGFCGFVAFPVLYTIGQQRTSALHGALILAGLPVLTGLYAALIERAWPGWRWLAGCAIALGGEAWLVAARSPAPADGGDLVGDAIIAASAFVVALGYVVGARATQLGAASLATTLWGIAAAAAVLAPWLAAELVLRPFPAAGAAAWGSTLWLALVTSIVGYVGWYWALARGGIARVGTLQFFQPISGLALAIVVLGEAPSPSLGLAAVLILGGVLVAQLRR